MDMDKQIEIVNSKFTALMNAFTTKLPEMDIEDIKECESALKNDSDKLSIRITAVRALRTDTWIEANRFEESIRPFLEAKGFNPIIRPEDERTIERYNAKREVKEIRQVKVFNNLKNDWKNKDKILTIINTLENYKIGAELQRELDAIKDKMVANDTDKIKTVASPGIIKKYASEFKFATAMADSEYEELKRDMNIRGYYLRAQKSFISMKLNILRARRVEITESKKAAKANEGANALSAKYGKRPVKNYGAKKASLDSIAKKFNLI